MAVKKDILFIVGCPRSGTTFLAMLLREYLNIGFANELQFIPRFHKKLKKYGDLSNEKNFDRLLNDILKDSFFSIFQKAYTKYLKRPVQITKTDIIELLPEKSFAGIIYAILNAVALKLNKKRIGTKHPTLALHLDILNELFPKCKVINIIRDGRDCAISFYYEVRWGHTNAYMSAVTWKEHVLKAREFGYSVLKGRYIELRYEDLVNNPLKELNRLKEFIGIDSNEINLDNFKYEIEAITKKDNIYKWKELLSEKDIAIFQDIAGDMLKEYGYEIFPKIIKLSNWQKVYYRIKDQIYREYRYHFCKDLSK